MPSYNVRCLKQIRGNMGFCSNTTGHFIVYANNLIHYGPTAIFVCLHYHHRADLSEGIKHMQYFSGIFYRVCV